jgi:hypothetical protein
MPDERSDFEDPRFIPAVDLLRRTGADGFQIRYCDEEEPVIWMAAAEWGGHWEVAASMNPVEAVFRLCDKVIDGGTCIHCHRPAGFVPDFDPMPVEELVCWYQWDPENRTFRRGCEGSQ